MIITHAINPKNCFQINVMETIDGTTNHELTYEDNDEGSLRNSSPASLPAIEQHIKESTPVRKEAEGGSIIAANESCSQACGTGDISDSQTDEKIKDDPASAPPDSFAVADSEQRILTPDKKETPGLNVLDFPSQRSECLMIQEAQQMRDVDVIECLEKSKTCEALKKYDSEMKVSENLYSSEHVANKELQKVLTSSQYLNDFKTPSSNMDSIVVDAVTPRKEHSEQLTVEVVPKKLFVKEKKDRMSKTKRAGLVMSVPRVLNKLKEGRYSKRVGDTGAVYLASVLEYMLAEILELAGNCARFFRKKRITPRCIQLSLLHDKELNQLTKGVIVAQGGAKPYIHPVLLGGKETAVYDYEADKLTQIQVSQVSSLPSLALV